MLSTSELQQLKDRLRGSVIQKGDQGYDEARKVYNGMIDKRPGAIAKCVDAADVSAAIRFAREQDTLLAVRGGGHNGGGLGICDDGLVIDLSPVKYVRVDPGARTVRVGGGCTWGDVDHATHAYGLAVPTGIISTTGVGGLTLGGGLGHLTRKHGLTIDNLLEADIVLADGNIVTASADEYPDLFWGIRGGGGNFGVVTSFLFRAHNVHTIVGGPTFWPIEKSEEVLKWYRDFILQAPDDLNGFFAYLTVPPAPPFPEELHGRMVCGIVWCYAGPLDKADEVFQPVKDFGGHLLYGIHDMPHPALQTAFDPFYPPGLQWYWRADFVNEINDAAVDRHAEFGAAMPTGHSTMHLYPIDGAAHRIGNDETPWAYRDANWSQVVVGVDPDPANGEAITAWTKDYHDALHPYSAGGAYVNFMMEEGQERVKATYRGNYDRLVQVKNTYDPTNLFRVNQNVRPTV
jgi:FAD/FMN-containing dehydrogenase